MIKTNNKTLYLLIPSISSTYISTILFLNIEETVVNKSHLPAPTLNHFNVCINSQCLTNTHMKGIFINILSRNEFYILVCVDIEPQCLLFAIIGAKDHYPDACQWQI